MVDASVIIRRLKKLDSYLAILQSLQNYDKEAFLSTPEYYGSAERFLHLSIEALLDIGNHLIADQNLGEVRWYRDIPEILNKKGIINDQQEKTWIRMIGFRNALVHDYLDIDRSIVFDVLNKHLNEIDDIKKQFVSLL